MDRSVGANLMDHPRLSHFSSVARSRSVHGFDLNPSPNWGSIAERKQTPSRFPAVLCEQLRIRIRMIQRPRFSLKYRDVPNAVALESRRSKSEFYFGPITKSPEVVGEDLDGHTRLTPPSPPERPIRWIWSWLSRWLSGCLC